MAKPQQSVTTLCASSAATHESWGHNPPARRSANQLPWHAWSLRQPHIAHPQAQDLEPAIPNLLLQSKEGEAHGH